MKREGVPTWDEYFLQIAEVVKLRSKDPNTQIGCVLVDPDNQIIATGYNDLPRGCENLPERFIAPEKYNWMVHAEENAYMAAARRGVSTKDSRLYLSSGYFPCRPCADKIVQGGTRSIHVPEPDFSKEAFRFDLSLTRLTEAGVQVEYHR